MGLGTWILAIVGLICFVIIAGLIFCAIYYHDVYMEYIEDYLDDKIGDDILSDVF